MRYRIADTTVFDLYDQVSNAETRRLVLLHRVIESEGGSRTPELVERS